MRIRLAGVIVLFAFAVAPGSASVDPARAFLAATFAVSTAEQARLDRDGVISRTLPATNKREVATLGIARIQTTPARYVERLTDIVAFKKTPDVLQIGRFSDVPSMSDIAALTLDDADITRLRKCRVDDCDLRLSAAGIDKLQSEVNWGAADASQQATTLVRRLLVDYVARYREYGATMEYANRTPRLDVGREFESMIAGDTVTASSTRKLRHHLLAYPKVAPEASDFIYWSKELVRGKPVVSVTHVAIVAPGDGTAVAYAIGSKQIYAMHYFDASLGLTLLVPDATGTATYVVYLNRSRIDLFDGMMGGIVRRLVASRARGLVGEQLQRLQRMFGRPVSVSGW